MSRLREWTKALSARIARHRVPLAIMLAALAMGAAMWLVSPATNKFYNFALLAVAAAAALLSAVELVRGETHQREATRQLDNLAGLLGVRVSLRAGFAGAAEGEVLDEIDVTPDWTDRAGPAVKQPAAHRHTFETASVDLYAGKERASDLVAVSFRVSNVEGRDPATNVVLVVRLPEHWEAYAEDEFETLRVARHTSAAHPEWGPEVNKAEGRRRVTFGATTIVNGTYVTMEWVWLRLPPLSEGAFTLGYSLAADRITPTGGHITIKVSAAQTPVRG
jgi:hypothetical protein